MKLYERDELIELLTHHSERTDYESKPVVRTTEGFEEWFKPTGGHMFFMDAESRGSTPYVRIIVEHVYYNSYDEELIIYADEWEHQVDMGDEVSFEICLMQDIAELA